MIIKMNIEIISDYKFVRCGRLEAKERKELSSPKKQKTVW